MVTLRSHRNSSELTNEGHDLRVGVASVRCRACGNGLRRSRQALIFVKLLIKQKFVASAASERKRDAPRREGEKKKDLPGRTNEKKMIR